MSYTINWTKTDDYLEGNTKNFKLTNKLAMFDLDHTLVAPVKGKIFSVDSDDWKFLHNNVPNKIKELTKNDYSIIIMSNQKCISKGTQNAQEWMDKINNIVNKLKCDIFVFCSTDDNKFRKPSPCFFNEKILTQNKNIDYSKSFYCGDAAGREKDFSDTDYKFALNCKLTFMVPEQLFLEENIILPQIEYIDFNNLKKNKMIKFVPNKKKEMIIMVGLQGSGKSSLSKHISEKYGYEIVNQDTLKTKAKCVKKVTELVTQNKSFIVDCTNPSKEARKEWIALIDKDIYDVRVILMTTPKEICMHNNTYRAYTTDAKFVPEIAYRMYKSKFKEPELSEGFSEIIKTDMCGVPTDEKYYMYLY